MRRLSWDEIHSRAIAFSGRWAAASRERADSQLFIAEFLAVFGVPDPAMAGERDKLVKKSGSTDNWIDFFWKNKIAIEMKSKGEKLGKARDQLRRYLERVPPDEVPDLWMTCDFGTFELWRHSTRERTAFKLQDLRKHIRRFADIAGYETERVRDAQIEVNVKAAEKMAKLHDALAALGYDGHALEVYLVRLLFCLFADDTAIFPKGSLRAYIERSKPDGSDLTDRIGRLFETLNMPEEARAKRKLLPEELRRFRYVNGQLFGEWLPSADFDAKMRKTLLDCMDFDWSGISPAIFGAMFQGVMDKSLRREMGAHYTSEENILKVINPLFMDGLWKEFDRVKADPKGLDAFHRKLGELKFLDPACGCGNFLVVTYRELRRLELEVLKMKSGSRKGVLDISMMLRVGVEQFHGIEILEFPCQVAQVGLWLADHQMNLRASEEFGQYFARLPLARSATIVHANALRMDWESVVPKNELSHILGNPPFVGSKMMSAGQREDMALSLAGDGGEWPKGAGILDYVAAWYRKAAEYMVGTGIRAAFVSTSSITQGEQAAALWKPLAERFGVHIDFGHRTFKWSNEAKGKAAVHCVIIGFSALEGGDPKAIFDGDGTRIAAKNINGYLLDAPDIFLENRGAPIGDAPPMGIGNKPIDDGHYLFTDTEKEEFLQIEPQAIRWFRPWIGADEFINGWRRWCLWLGDCPPDELRRMPEAMKRVEAVKRFRLASKSAPTRKIAEKPRRFHVENMPTSNYIIVPRVSSEKRKYIPIGFLPPDILASDSAHIIAGGTLYHFGVLTSSVHMAWTRTICGRLESRYRYSAAIVYNNFVWPEAADARKSEIERLARAILDARAQHPNSSLADLYDPISMPADLLKAHQLLDRAVMKLYGFPRNATESAIVALLINRYRTLVKS